MSFYFMVHNFVKIHKTIKKAPAMEAGVTDYLGAWRYCAHERNRLSG
ncbi:hypothetical protein APY03_0213 [Variovorax sp. WDL1]|nr:hypothetical protein APY03_0213 [Variovorax sp. WDL1]